MMSSALCENASSKKRQSTPHGMTSKQAPEIFQRRLDDLDLDGLPPRSSEQFAPTLISRYALEYAQRGWNALVTVDDDYVRVLAIPENSVEPKAYVLGLLQNRFLDDALPLLQALSGMVNDADIEYNLGICLSELGRTEECIAPLEMCVTLDPGYANAYVGLGVAYTRLGKQDLAESALKEAIRLDPQNAFAKRNLAASLARGGKPKDALPYFRQAVSLARAIPAPCSASPNVWTNSARTTPKRPAPPTIRCSSFFPIIRSAISRARPGTACPTMRSMAWSTVQSGWTR